jgi:hypothetical protein
MSEAIIVGLIAAGASIAGTLASYLKNSNTNKKKFDRLEQGQDKLEKKLLHFETNDLKHMELDPNGATMKKIDGMAADIIVLKQDIKGIKRYAHSLDSILLDKKVLTNQQAETLNAHIDS